jgi:hypothetical protein
VERSVVQQSFPGNVFRKSATGFPTSRCRRRPRGRLSIKRAACRPSKPQVFTGNPEERSGEICGGSFLEMFSCRVSIVLHSVKKTDVADEQLRSL